MNAERRRVLEKELQDILKIHCRWLPPLWIRIARPRSASPKSKRNWRGCGNEEMRSSRCLTRTVPKRT